VIGCPSLDACVAERHPVARCAECPAIGCALSLEHGRCLVCIARRLRRARREGRLDAYGLPAARVVESDPRWRWGEVWREPGPRRAIAAQRTGRSPHWRETDGLRRRDLPGQGSRAVNGRVGAGME
jgi:hypothetical protein